MGADKRPLPVLIIIAMLNRSFRKERRTNVLLYHLGKAISTDYSNLLVVLCFPITEMINK